MKNTQSIAIIGNKETILGFKALGVKPFEANSNEEAVTLLNKLASEQIPGSEKEDDLMSAYAIIFITEELMMNIPKDDYKKLSQLTLPAIIPIPGPKGTTGYGIKRIGKMVEQAVGSDIFGDK